MRILLDHCVPAGLRKYLSPHTVKTARQMGWGALKNGALLTEAQHEFDVLITTDTNLKYQQQLPDYDLALIVLRAQANRLPFLLELAPEVLRLVTTLQPGQAHYLFTRKLREIEQRRGRPFKQ